MTGFQKQICFCSVILTRRRAWTTYKGSAKGRRKAADQLNRFGCASGLFALPVRQSVQGEHEASCDFLGSEGSNKV